MQNSARRLPTLGPSRQTWAIGPPLGSYVTTSTIAIIITQLEMSMSWTVYIADSRVSFKTVLPNSPYVCLVLLITIFVICLKPIQYIWFAACINSSSLFSHSCQLQCWIDISSWVWSDIQRWFDDDCMPLHGFWMHSVTGSMLSTWWCATYTGSTPKLQKHPLSQTDACLQLL